MKSLAAVLAALLLQAQPAPPGRHMGVFGDPETALRASADADAAGDRFQELLGKAPVKGALILAGEPPRRAGSRIGKGLRWEWTWKRTTGAERDETMTHELGHLWLIFWADGLEAPKVRRYGSSLPDWFDEAVACLLEGPRMQKIYAGIVRRRVSDDTAMPLAELLACLHPDSREESNREKARDRMLFYSQAWSVASFIADRYGPKAFRHVAETLKAGKPFEAALGAHGLPKQLPEFEEAWKGQVLQAP